MTPENVVPLTAPCPICEGAGLVVVPVSLGHDVTHESRRCGRYNGTGHVIFKAGLLIRCQQIRRGEK